jgi:hypothetical protein
MIEQSGSWLEFRIDQQLVVVESTISGCCHDCQTSAAHAKRATPRWDQRSIALPWMTVTCFARYWRRVLLGILLQVAILLAISLVILLAISLAISPAI